MAARRSNLDQHRIVAACHCNTRAQAISGRTSPVIDPCDFVLGLETDGADVYVRNAPQTRAATSHSLYHG